MRKITRAVTAMAFAAGVVATGGLTNAQAAGSSWDGCPSGAVCVYAQDAEAVTPTDVYWSYGAHNLSNQVGWHWVLNNQTGGAHARLCLGSNGTNCNYDMAAQHGVRADLTPVNSITLDRP
ncbi:hypothetical protein [Streptomyces sp. NBC_01477]|uniref:hypothetical protein n=1 Tax=Streptomyces sp. NBC_01477 TaxID=2976015 RepID=UPI002E311BB5|nr:hypothetical protein [Streptomyces sp. NBC_01477]